ncbi:TPA: hypothetical protein ACH3X3_003515 [Trebouxia sp. C0006]
MTGVFGVMSSDWCDIFIKYTTGVFGVMSSDWCDVFIKPWLGVQPTQQQIQHMKGILSMRKSSGYLTAAVSFSYGLATMIFGILRCFVENADYTILDSREFGFRQMVLGAWFIAHAAVAHTKARKSGVILQILSLELFVDNDALSAIKSTEHDLARSKSCSW